MRRVILDTDVASLSIKQQLPSPLLRGLLGARVGVTFVTLGELTRWATLRQWGPIRAPNSMAGSPPVRRSPTPTRLPPLGRDLRPRDPTRSFPPA